MSGLNARTRLTLLSALLFAAAGIALVVINYSLVSAGLPIPSAGSDPTGDQLISPGERPVLGSPEPISVAVNESLVRYRSEVLTTLIYQSGIALLVALSLSVLLGWIVAGRVLRPLREMTTAARELSQTDLSLRLPVPHPRDEIRTLAETFNGMLSRIESAFAHERRMVADLSHEIRTPLANQRVAIEVTLSDPDATAEELRETLAVVAGETRRSQLVSERILHLAQAQGTDPSQDEVVEFSEIVQSALEECSADAGAVEARLVPVLIRADGVLVRRMVDNLLDNAVSHGTGRVFVDLSREDDRAVLRIDNDGPPLTAAEVGEFTKPFHRSRAARKARGVGLGLAIVSAIVQRHGGELELSARAAGGLSVSISIPTV